MRSNLAYLVAAVLWSSTVFAQQIFREAESTNLIASGMKIRLNSNASGGKYVSAHEDDSGSATYLINISTAGRYRLEARVKSPSTAKNSFYVSVDGGSKVAWHLPILGSYSWTARETLISFSAGSHQLKFHGREGYTQLDAFKLTLVDSAVTPTPSPTPAPSPMPSATPAPTPMPPTSGLNPNVAPARNFDLSLWKITLPIDSSKGFSGTAVEVRPIPLDYQLSPYFYTAADGGMVFMAPVEGATTSGSKYPRTELREMKADNTLAAWTTSQGGTLSATLAVNELPVTSTGAKGRIVVGQIHGPDDELCRLYYDNGKLYFHDDKAGSSQVETRFTLKSSAGAETSIPLASKFDYTIKVANGYQTVSAVHNGVTYSATEPLSSFWPGKSLYFKAGIYVQVGKPGSGAGTTGSGKGQVTFYRLTRPSHP